jgi:hypothetical protein
MTEFSWKRDLNIVMWRATILHNLLRSLCAGIVWGTLMLVVLVGAADPAAPSPAVALLYPVVAPLGYFFFLLPVGLVSGFLSRLGVPFAGFISIVFSLFIVAGDPLVWMLKRIKPQLVAVEAPGFFEFTVIVFVVDEEKERALQERVVGAVRGLQGREGSAA